MNKTSIFVLGLIGSIIGILGSLVWMFIGTFFIAGMIDSDLPLDAPLTDGAFAGGLIIAVAQGILTIAMFIMTLIKSTPQSLAKGMKNSGVWLLVLGIISAIFNLFNLIPCVLLIIAGALGLQGAAKQKEDSEIRFIDTGSE